MKVDKDHERTEGLGERSRAFLFSELSLGAGTLVLFTRRRAQSTTAILKSSRPTSGATDSDPSSTSDEPGARACRSVKHVHIRAFHRCQRRTHDVVRHCSRTEHSFGSLLPDALHEVPHLASTGAVSGGNEFLDLQIVPGTRVSGLLMKRS